MVSLRRHFVPNPVAIDSTDSGITRRAALLLHARSVSLFLHTRYDNVGRNTSILGAIAGLTPSVAVVNTFDADSRRTQAAFSIGGTGDLVNNYAFDNLGRMTRVEQTSQQGGYTVAPKRMDFAYDAASQWDTITRYANLAGTQLVATSDYTFDSASRLTALAHAKGGNTLASYTWSYDSVSRVTQLVSSTDGTAN
jgi:hypothetical protein